MHLGMEWIQVSEKHFLKALQPWNVCTRRKNTVEVFLFEEKHAISSHSRRNLAQNIWGCNGSSLQLGSFGDCKHSWLLQSCFTVPFCHSCYLCVCTWERRKYTLCFFLSVQKFWDSCNMTEEYAYGCRIRQVRCWCFNNLSRGLISFLLIFAVQWALKNICEKYICSRKERKVIKSIS